MTASPDDLSPAQQVTYLVGLVAREGVWLDRQVRTLYADLVGRDSAARWICPRELGAAISVCRTMIANTEDLADDQRERCDKALAAALLAYNDRNKYVHDALVEGPDGALERHKNLYQPPSKYAPPARETLERLRASHSALVAAWWRVEAVKAILKGATEALTAADAQGIVRGEFEVIAGEGRGIIWSPKH